MAPWFSARAPLFFLALISVTTIGLLGCGTDDPSLNQSHSNHSSTDNDTSDNDATPAVEPGFETYFTRPQPGEPDETVEQSIVDLIDGAPSDATVRAAFYTFGREHVAEAFADAHERGVDVRIVLGNTSTHPNGNDWSAVTILRDRLGDRLTICEDGQSEGGCMGENIQHNKFVTFSEIADGSRDVVLQTSANLTEFQLSQFNNLVLLHDDAALYEVFVSYWQDLQRDELNLTYDRHERGDSGTKAYFFPLSSGDPILDALESVDCSEGADIYVAMAFFTNSRSDVAEELRSMDEAGCGIHVVLRERPEISSPGIQIMGNLENGDIDIGIFPDGDEIQLHSKYMLVDGAYGPDQESQRILWTGSHNFTVSALRYNDEAILKIRDDDVFDAYLDDWHHLRDRAQTVHP